MIGVLGHVDVVPEGAGWQYSPYAAEIYDGKIYGRESIGDKGTILAALYGLRAIKDVGLKLSRRVRILFGSTEETNFKDIEYYLKELELMVKNGMSSMETIIATIRVASGAIGLNDKIGTLEKGKLANLVVADGNPLEDIAILQNKELIKVVMKEGKKIIERE